MRMKLQTVTLHPSFSLATSVLSKSQTEHSCFGMKSNERTQHGRGWIDINKEREMQYLKQSFTLPASNGRMTDAEYAIRVGNRQETAVTIHPYKCFDAPEHLLGIPTVVGICTCAHFINKGWCLHE